MTRARLLARVFAATVILTVAGSLRGSAEQTVASVKGRSEGRGLFQSYCSSCHGVAGKGDGPVATRLKPPPADLTQLSRRHKGIFPADEVRKTIDGRGRSKPHNSQMPEWGVAFSRTTEETDEVSVKRRIEALVAFIETLQADDSTRP